MTMKNDQKPEEELTCHFKIDITNLTNFDSRAWKVSNICTSMGCFWPNYIMLELRYGMYRACLIALKTDAKFEGKLTCAF